MNVNLGSTFDQFVSDLVASGLYQSQSEVLRESLRLLKEREDTKSLRLQEFRRELAVGIGQADRGQFVDGQKAFQNLRKKSEERRRKAA
jgi:antitoxin ParD1/3/4